MPTIGSCPGQFTANTMAMVAETLGFALPGVATMPAVYSAREALARETGQAVMRSCSLRSAPPRFDHPRESENACAVVGATGGSTNAMLHIPALRTRPGSSSTSMMSRR